MIVDENHIIDALAMPIAVLDETGVITRVNNAWLLFSEKNSQNDVIGHSPGVNYLTVWQSTGKQRDNTEFAAATDGIQSVLNGQKKVFTLEYPCHSLTEEYWFEMQVTALKGDIKGAVLIHDNITERKKYEGREYAELGSLKNKERLKIAQQTAKIGNWEFDVETKSLFWSDEMFRLHGIQPFREPPLFHDNIQIYTEESKVQLRRCLSMAFSNGIDFNVELELNKIARQAGLATWFNSICHAVCDEKGTVIRLEGTVQDISERKVFEQELRYKSLMLNKVFSIFPVGITVLDEHRKVIEINPALEKMLKFSQGDWMAQMYPERRYIKHDGSTLLEEDFPSVKAMRELITVGPMDVGIIMGDGSLIWTEVTAVPLMLESVHCLVVSSDITERKKIQSDLIKAKESADVANEAKTTFLATMSHEIRTPLNAIVGFSQLLLRRSQLFDHSLIPDYFQDYLKNITDSGLHLTALINDILELSHIESGKAVVNWNHIDIRKIIDTITGVFQGIIHEKNLIMECRVDDNFPLQIYSDEGKINQIITNLLSNACKFSPIGHTVRTEVRKQGKFCIITVSDDGIGIALENQALIFDPFVQVDQSLTRKFGGTGLGLAITQRLTAILGGTIEIDSELHKGATFTVKLPLNDVLSKNRNTEKNTMQNKFRENSKILVIEDEPLNQELFQALADDLGLNIIIASDAKMGLTEIEMAEKAGEVFDLIFMDIHLPGMNGIEAASRIRNKLKNDVPIVGISADAFMEQQMKALEVGMDGYLTKPIEFDKLYAVLNTYLGV